MFWINRIKSKAGLTRRIATILSAAAIMGVFITPGVWSAQASTLDQSKGSSAEGSAGSPSATCPQGGQCFADVPSANPFYTFVNRIYQQDLVTGYPCGGPGEPCDANNSPYYRPGANVTRQQMAKYIDNARHLSQIDIQVTGGEVPIRASNDTGTAISAYSSSGQALTAISNSQLAIYAQTGNSTAISGNSMSGADGVGVYGSGHIGVRGAASGNSAYGVYASAGGTASVGVKATGPLAIWGEGSLPNGGGVLGVGHGVGSGVRGSSNGGNGVFGETYTGTAVYGWSYDTGYAGWFVGDVRINGNCCAMGAGTTQIDDPLDPTGKVVNQALVQSSDMIGIYRGHVTLDATGSATAQLPAYFEALYRDYDYQLTPVGAPMPNLYVAEEVQDNTFKIAGGNPGSKVSWQVTGTRKDPYAEAHPMQAEQDKSAEEKGKYLYPSEYGQPESLGIDYAIHQKKQDSDNR